MNKSTFFTGQPVFGQLLRLIPRNLVNRVSRRYHADRYCKRFTTYDHLVTMLYSIFNNCNSLREVTTGLLAWEQRLQHLGIKSFPRRSTISDANQRRHADVFEQLYLELLGQHSAFLPDSRTKDRLGERLYVFDSTTITLFQEVLKGAGSRGLNGKRKGGIKVHTLLKSDQDVPVMICFSASSKSDASYLKNVRLPKGSILVFDRGYNNYSTLNQLTADRVTWVSRLRKDSIYTITKEREASTQDKDKGLIYDQHIVMGHDHGQKAVKVAARLIKYVDPATQRVFEFITNNNRMHPLTIASLYKKRWQIELLFKRLKQNYPLKYFLGDSPNAIQIQIWCTLIADLLLKRIRRAAGQKWAFSNIVSMIRIHLMTYIDLKAFLKYPERSLLQMATKTLNNDSNLRLFPT